MNNITTEKSGKSGSELSVGQYIKYTPSGGSTTYSSTRSHNGNTDTTVSRKNLNWRILSVDGDSVKIISDVSSTNMTYKGAEGYNNVVKDLNEMCKTLYSHGTTYARSVNLDDFTNKSQTYTAGQYSATCPTIYPQEKVAGGSLDQSQQNDWVTGSTTSTSKMGTNRWGGSLPNTDPLYSSTYYFLASRCVYFKEKQPYYFYLQAAGGALGFYTLYYYYYSSFLTDKQTYPIRAVATLPASCTFGTEAGDEANPITINWPEEETGYICGRCATGDINHTASSSGDSCVISSTITCSKCGHYFVNICSSSNKDDGECYESLEGRFPCPSCSGGGSTGATS